MFIVTFSSECMWTLLLLPTVDIDMGNRESGSPLIQLMLHCYNQKSSEKLDMSIVQYYIEKGVVLSRVVNTDTWGDTTAFEFSITLIRLDVAKLLVNVGVDPIFGGDPKCKPLISEYIQLGSNHFLIWLMNEHLTTEEIPAFIDRVIEAAALTTRGFGRNGSHAFQLCGRREAVHFLLDKMPELLHECDVDGNTALHLAAERGDLNSVNILLQKLVIYISLINTV